MKYCLQMSILTGSVFFDFLGIVVVVCVGFYAYIQWSYQLWRRKNVPYFPATFPYGNRQPIHKTALGDDVFQLTKRAKEKGKDLLDQEQIFFSFLI